MALMKVFQWGFLMEKLRERPTGMQLEQPEEMPWVLMMEMY
jgi:hypothetical protein